MNTSADKISHNPTILRNCTTICNLLINKIFYHIANSFISLSEINYFLILFIFKYRKYFTTFQIIFFCLSMFFRNILLNLLKLVINFSIFLLKANSSTFNRFLKDYLKYLDKCECCRLTS